MLSAKYQPNQQSGSGEEVTCMFFTIYGHGVHLEFRLNDHFSKILYNHPVNAKYEFSLKLAQ